MSERGGRFAGRVCIVVGGHHDLGLAVAGRFLREGANVAVVGPGGPALDTAAQVLQGRTKMLPTGLTDPDGMREAAAAVSKWTDRIHVLVNFHHAVDWGTIEDSSLETWKDTLAMNLLGPVIATKAFLPLLRVAAGAAIVHMGSVDGLLGNPNAPAYSTSKGGLIALTHVMASEFAVHRIRVNCVGRVASSLSTSPAGTDYLDQLRRATPLARFGTPEETAAVVAFLASDDANYITGAFLPVDGGRTSTTPGTKGTG